MLSKEKLEEIEKLEKEQANIKARISALKENSNLNFIAISNCEKFRFIEELKIALRQLIIVISNAQHDKRDGRILIMGNKKKASELSEENIKYANNFIEEIAPIIHKYLELNASLFDVKK